MSQEPIQCKWQRWKRWQRSPCWSLQGRNNTMFYDVCWYQVSPWQGIFASPRQQVEKQGEPRLLLSSFVNLRYLCWLLITLANTPQSRPTFVSELILESFPGDWRELEQISPPLNSLIVACLSPNAWLSHAWLPRRTTSLPTLPSVDPPTLYY